MPKKWTGGNEKAMAAKERKAVAKDEQKMSAAKKAEDAMWEDDDKFAKKKAEKAALEEEKKKALAQKKALNRELEQTETATIEASTKKAPSYKKTVAEIEAAREAAARQNAKQRDMATQRAEHHTADWSEINPNRLARDAREEALESGAEYIEARDVESAVQALSGASLADIHPEKRMKAAYNAYRDRMMPILKAESPTLKHSQLNDRIFKMWQTAPENPKLQAAMVNTPTP